MNGGVGKESSKTSSQKSSGDSYRRMSTDVVSAICKAKGGFRTPELNEQLYLHFGGFARIEGLDEFVSCRVLWLENNCLTVIENLEPLVALSALYVQNNCLHSLGMCPVPSLRSLNVCHNNLSSLDGLQYMPNLEKLLASNNSISDIAALVHTPQLTVLDLSYNKLAGAEVVNETLKKLTLLASLMLHGNDVVREVKSYRETMIVEHENLRYLDEYPVFDDERRCCVAFWHDGEAGRKAEREKIRQEEKHRQEEQRAFFAKFIEDAKAKREAENGAPPPATEYYEEMSRAAGNASDPLADRHPAADITDDDDEDDVYVPKSSVDVAREQGTVFNAAAAPRTSSSVVAAAVGKHVDPMRSGIFNDEIAPAIDLVSINTTPAAWRKEVYQIPQRSASSPSASVPPPQRHDLTEDEVLDGFRSLIPTSVIEALERLSKNPPRPS